MGLFSEFFYANVGSDLVIVSAEANADSPKGEFKLIQNGIILDIQRKFFGRFSLTGKAGNTIEVKIKQELFGAKYQLLVNGSEHPLIKTTKAQAFAMIDVKRREAIREAENFDKKNAKIYPILKPGDWVGRKNAVHKIMIGYERHPQLVIGYGYDLPGSFLFLPAADLKSGSLAAIHEEALKNIEERPVPVEESHQLMDPILLASGDDFSAEKILSKPFLLEAQRKLGAEELLLSIPRRRCLMIGNRRCSKETLEMFIKLHRIAWNEDTYGNAPIFDDLLLAKNGQVQEALRLNN